MKMLVFMISLSVLYWAVSSTAQTMFVAAAPCAVDASHADIEPYAAAECR